MARTERTSARVAKIAAKVLDIKDIDDRQALCVWGGLRGGGSHFVGLTMGQVRTLAASALTQAPDKAEVQRLRKRLEIDHCFVLGKGGKMAKRKLKPGEDFPDGIFCRDATIADQKQYIEELQARLKAPAKPKRTREQREPAASELVPSKKRKWRKTDSAAVLVGMYLGDSKRKARPKARR